MSNLKKRLQFCAFSNVCDKRFIINMKIEFCLFDRGNFSSGARVSLSNTVLYKSHIVAVRSKLCRRLNDFGSKVKAEFWVSFPTWQKLTLWDCRTSSGYNHYWLDILNMGFPFPNVLHAKASHSYCNGIENHCKKSSYHKISLILPNQESTYIKLFC